MKEKIICIYKITNLVNGKIYVGSTKNFYRRRMEHIQLLSRNKSPSSILQFAWNKYEECNFEFSVLEVVENSDSLIEREQYWIDFLHPDYNVRKIADRNSGITFKMPWSGTLKLVEKLKKPVIQYDLEMNFIREWDSAVAIERELGITKSEISRVCKGNQKTSKGFIFKHKFNHIDYHGEKGKKHRKYKTDLELKEYRTLRKAKKYLIAFPNGHEEIIINLTGFCRSNNLSRSTFYTILSKNVINRKGWKVVKMDE